MNLAKLLLLHAIVTFAAGVVLIVTPELIPGFLGIHVTPSFYLVCYFLGTSELGLAVLSYLSRKLKDAQALRVIVVSFIVFHLSTAAVEVFYMFTQGISAQAVGILWGNLAVRILVSVAFGYFGLSQTATKRASRA